jgi:RNA polymerase sigma-70 factor (ECF subfamily)
MRDEKRDDLHRSIIEQLPHLRAFAVLLTRDRCLADDLVQEAVVRALAHADQFRQGTNFKAWITTILRNSYFNVLRQRSRVAPMSAVAPDVEPTISGGQEEHLGLRDFERVFACLPPAQREALLLVGASGFSYEAAADVAQCAVGTMKSRVARGRTQLAHLLDGEAELGDADDGCRPAAAGHRDHERVDWMRALTRFKPAENIVAGAGN